MSKPFSGKGGGGGGGGGKGGVEKRGEGVRINITYLNWIFPKTAYSQQGYLLVNFCVCHSF